MSFRIRNIPPGSNPTPIQTDPIQLHVDDIEREYDEMDILSEERVVRPVLTNLLYLSFHY